MGDIAIDVFLATLKNLITSSNYLDLAIDEKDQLQSLADEINYLRGFLKITENKRNERSEVMNLVTQIRNVVSEAENVVELYVALVFKANHASDPLPAHRDLSLDLESVRKEIQTLMIEVKRIWEENMYGQNLVAVKELEHSSAESGERSNRSKAVEGNVVVGLEEEVKILMGKLDDSGESGLEIISIIGAAGGGKTTLAREVYDQHWTSEHFEIRAWVVVSQDYNKTMKKDLLIRILKSAFPENNEEYETSNESSLGEKLLKCLKGKKYLIVMDDIWGTEAWIDMERSFPREHKRSKVMFTSRQSVQLDNIHCVPHILVPLTESCSWQLLVNKVFGEKPCPLELVEIGKQIVQKCEGLPLAIVAIAGILVIEDKKHEVWEKILKKLSSIMSKDGCMEILELSYNHLPLHLKACFLYIGAHPEDYEINVRELIWLWIADGFIQQSDGQKTLEAVAKDCLNNLIDRNLVMVAAKNGYSEGIKKCRIHDLLRQLCLEKANKDNFHVQFFKDGSSSGSKKKEDGSSSLSATNNCRRLFIGHMLFHTFSSRHHAENLRSFVCFSLPYFRLPLFEQNLSFFVENFKLLRVLSFIPATSLGEIGIGDLVLLRYLALTIEEENGLPVNCFHYLPNLETLILHQIRGKLSLPPNVFKMVKLMHLYSNLQKFNFHDVSYDEDGEDKLDSLHTLGPMCGCPLCLSFLKRTPNLRKLFVEGWQVEPGNVLMLPDLEFLKFLDKLSIWRCFQQNNIERVATTELKLPGTLTRLTLIDTYLKWEQISIILQKIPSLQVLKLLIDACEGPVWDTTSEEFEEMSSQLKYLKLSFLDIEKWEIASEDQFPRLEVLVIECCFELEGIPMEFANLCELREIRVTEISKSAMKSAKKIRKESGDIRGDDCLINILLVDGSGNAAAVDDQQEDDDDDDDDGAEQDVYQKKMVRSRMRQKKMVRRRKHQEKMVQQPSRMHPKKM